MHRDSGAAVYEFFAGGGLARLGLAPSFRTVFANDVCAHKAKAYRAAFGPQGLIEGDIASLTPDQLPGHAQLAWASFPCQDLSLAGMRAGLGAARSGTFHSFWRLMEALAAQGRGPEVVAIENVTGLLSSHSGADFTAIVQALVDGGYRVGAVIGDARWFVPQSRPRLFLIASRRCVPDALTCAGPALPWHPPALARAVTALPDALRAGWLWWHLKPPSPRTLTLADILQSRPDQACWHGPDKTARLLAQMSPAHRDTLASWQAQPGRHIGTLFRRIRQEAGQRVQRAELRNDGLAGCLRPPTGGSSRQILVLVEDGLVRSRLLSPRECARLMGVPDTYPLPQRQTQALHLLGDGVSVPVVDWLRDGLLAPLAAAASAARGA